MLLLAFVGVSLVVICTPGPDTALAIRNTLAGGRRGGVLTAAGVSAGQLSWTVASAFGLAALLQASQTVLGWLKLAGAAYLIFLGVRSLISAWARRSVVWGVAPPLTVSGSAALRQGLLSNLANPKMVAFFLSVLPQFIPVGWSPLAGFLGLGVTFCLLTLAVAVRRRCSSRPNGPRPALRSPGDGRGCRRSARRLGSATRDASQPSVIAEGSRPSTGRPKPGGPVRPVRPTAWETYPEMTESVTRPPTTPRWWLS